MATITEPLDVLIQAIIAKWAATPALNGNISGPWRAELPTGTQANPPIGQHFPYCVIPDEKHGLGSMLERMTCATEYWRHNIPFRLYDVSPEACRMRVAAVDAVFWPSNLSLPLARGELVMHRRIRQRYVHLDGVWYAETTYQFETSWPRA